MPLRCHGGKHTLWYLVPALLCCYILPTLLFLAWRGAVPFAPGALDVELPVLFYGLSLMVVTAVAGLFLFRRRIAQPLARLTEQLANARNGLADSPLDRSQFGDLAPLANACRELTISCRFCHRDYARALDLSRRLASGEENLRDLLRRFLSLVKEELGYLSAEVCFHYRYTEALEQVMTDGCSSPPRNARHLLELALAGEVRHEPRDNGLHTLYLPMPLASPDKADTPPRDDAGQGLHSWGVLIVTSTEPPSPHGITLLKLVASELAHLADLYERRLYEKKLADAFAQVNRMAIHALAVADVPHLFQIMADCGLMRSLFDGMALWLHEEDHPPDGARAYFTPTIPPFDYRELGVAPLRHQPVERYDLTLDGCHSVILCPLIKGEVFFGVIGFFKSYKRFLRPEERTAALLISQQVSFNIESIALRDNLATRNRELKYQKEFSEMIFASINSGIIVVDEKGAVLTANTYSLTILGYSATEMIGANLDRLVPGLFTAAISGQQEGEFTLENGRALHLGFALSHMKDSDRHLGKIILFRDITEIMNLREQLRRKEYFSTIGEMASWIAHEVRNPVFAIASIARILQKKAQDHDQERFITSILKETESLNVLVDDLLMYGKPLALNLQPLDLSRFIVEVSDGLRSLAMEAGAEIITHLPDQEVTTAFDQDRMKQVLYNLIGNGLDAGASEIAITVDRCRNPLRLILRDNGKGIKAAHIPKMFTPFFTTKKTGTGLGLPICKKIIEAHGGLIAITSEQDQGTEVTIELG